MYFKELKSNISIENVVVGLFVQFPVALSFTVKHVDLVWYLFNIKALFL